MKKSSHHGTIYTFRQPANGYGHRRDSQPPVPVKKTGDLETAEHAQRRRNTEGGKK